MGMLTLFLRAILLYLFILLVIRLTGKRQIADLQPFDLLITLSIADLASCAIADTDIPLLYSIVPILALFFVQQAVAKLCLKSRTARRVVCGSPLVLIRDGVLQQKLMREANYTIADVMDNLREKDIFDLGQVAYAILETNGSLSVLQKGAFQQPTLKDLQLPADEAELSSMLILDGRLCPESLKIAGVDRETVLRALPNFGVRRVEELFYLQAAPDGEWRAQRVRDDCVIVRSNCAS